MHDFCTPNADEMNYSELAEKVRYHKQETEGVRTMCRIVEEYGKEREAEGLKRGMRKNAIANAKNLLRMNLGSLEQISQAVSLPLEQVLALKEELDREAVDVTK